MTHRPWFSGLLLLGALFAGALIAGCSGDDATGPSRAEPGQLQVTVTAGSAGALVLHVTGPSISNPAAVGGIRMYQDLSGNTLKAAVVGTSLNGAVLRFSVSDTRRVSDYLVTVQQAAGNDNEPLAASSVIADVTAVP